MTNTHTEVARLNGGGLAERVETRCRQLVSLLREWRETLCSLEADLNQVGPVELRGVEGASAADGCTRSLGGMEAPGALEVTRFPGVNVPVCVVSRCVCTRAWQNACCNARIARVKGVVREEPRA